MDISPPQARSEAREPAQRLARVLVVDDDESVTAAIRTILARHGFETEIYLRAYAGIRALQQSAFDVVLLDIFMPGLNGLDAIEHIRRNSSIPIIAMSGFCLRSSAGYGDCLSLAAQRGATCCIRKPFQTAQLIEAIERSQSSFYPAQGSAS
jgi:CheY-like chemotaxis protein